MARKQRKNHGVLGRTSAPKREPKEAKPIGNGELVAVWKLLGETPLEALNRLRIEKPQYATSTLSYAGRLDPAAEGVLLVLVNDANKSREKYLELDKTYELRILFGVSTDTYDALGTVTKATASISPDAGHHVTPEDFKKKAEDARRDFIGSIIQDYPPYSSKTIDGKALFQWAREGKLAEGATLQLPTHTVNISSITIKGWEEIRANPLYKHIEKICSLVKGDFRQKTIIESWGLAMGARESAVFHILRLSISCGSGTYMRTLAYDFGKKVGLPALALSIVRTKTGKFTKKDCAI